MKISNSLNLLNKRIEGACPKNRAFATCKFSNGYYSSISTIQQW